MLKTLTNAFKVKEVRNRLLFTFAMLVVIRFGCQLPVPGVNRDFFSQWFEQQTAGTFGFFDAFTGGSFLRMSVLALNITPYITSSIIMQLLTIAIPKLEEMQKDGEDGRKKIQAITRYVTVGLALIESSAMAIGFGNQGLLQGDIEVIDYIVVIAALTAGSAFLMWVGERITEKGVGNGISIVLIINIISRIPSDMVSLWEKFVSGKNVGNAAIAIVVVLAVILATVILVVILQEAKRTIPVQYSKKIQGRRTYGGNTSHIPLKVNTGGIMPVIFAQSLMQTPVIIATFFGAGQGTGFWDQILHGLSESYWFNKNNWIYTIGALVYILLIIAFAYFYTSITFNPLEIADNLKKSGGFIPGIRPGKPTSDYLTTVLNSVILIGALGLSIVSIVPIALNGIMSANVSFGGTSIIIVVGVVIETLQQIESQMMVRNYHGFLSE